MIQGLISLILVPPDIHFRHRYFSYNASVLSKGGVYLNKENEKGESVVDRVIVEYLSGLYATLTPIPTDVALTLRTPTCADSPHLLLIQTRLRKDLLHFL